MNGAASRAQFMVEAVRAVLGRYSIGALNEVDALAAIDRIVNQEGGS